jgi:glycine cleavage system H lipoate-binding protein
MMQERQQAEPLPVHASGEAAGFDLAEGFYYHDGHAWARPEYGGRVRVGLDDFARKLLGSKSQVVLPEVGQEVRQGESGFMVKRNGESAQVLSPLDGTVSHVNHRLLDHPELINTSPYDEGWLFTVEPVKLRKNLKGLYFGDDAHDFISQEREKLFAMANEDMEISADGGESVEDIFEALDAEDWAKFVKAFLKT